MTTAIRLCGPDDLTQLLLLMARFHEERGIVLADEQRADSVAPLLDGSPYGAAYLLGPTRGPVGYVIVTFGWSIELGGMEAIIDEIFVRDSIRGRGIASEVLLALARSLQTAGVRAIHIEVKSHDAVASRLYQRSGFEGRDQVRLMTRKL